MTESVSSGSSRPRETLFNACVSHDSRGCIWMKMFSSKAPWCSKNTLNRAFLRTSLLHVIVLVVACPQVGAGGAPVIKSGGSSVLRVASQVTALMACEASGNPTPAIKWTRDGVPVKNITNRYLVNKKNGALLIFLVRLQDEGFYKCTATNSKGVDTLTVELQVLSGPSVPNISLSQPLPDEGSNLTLKCTASGRPRPTLEWYNNKQMPTHASLVSSKYLDKGTTEMTLRLWPVRYDDRGSFHCMATNSVSKSRASVFVDVQFRPRILSPFPDKPVFWWAGHITTITCQSIGNPAPSIKWIKRNAFRFQEHIPRTPVIQVSGGNKVSSSIKFVPTNMTNDIGATYKCVSSNKHGVSDSAVFEMRKAELPPAPETHVISMHEDVMELSIFIPPRENAPPYTYISVLYKRDGTEKWLDFGENLNSNEAILTIQGLMRNRFYELILRVKNKVGYSSETTLRVFFGKMSTTTTISTTSASTTATTESPTHSSFFASLQTFDTKSKVEGDEEEEEVTVQRVIGDHSMPSFQGHHSVSLIVLCLLVYILVLHSAV